MKKSSLKSISLAGFITLLCAGCGSSGTGTFGPSVFVLNVTSVNPVAGVQLTSISPIDNNGAGTNPANNLTSLNLVYNKGTSVTLTAPPSQVQGAFVGWTGCDSTTALTCTVAMTGPKAVQAQYTGVSNIVILPVNPIAGVPSTIQFSTTVNGIGTCMLPAATGSGAAATPVPCAGSPVQYTLTQTGAPGGFANPSAGTIDSTTGLYTSPFPAPMSVTVTATSVIDPGISSQTMVTFDTTVAATGPALSVDLGSPTHAISPYIYGMNDYGATAGVPAMVDLPIERWGGDLTTRYNYTNDADNSASDFFFENSLGTGSQENSSFNKQVALDLTTNTKTLVTVPLIGYTTLGKAGCSFSVAKYGAQASEDPSGTCGNGKLSGNNNQVNNDPTDTSYAIDETFDSGWVNYLDNKFGTAANGGVAIYALDNEPEYWYGVHIDVKKTPMTYDTLTNGGLTYAAAIKAADPSALVTGPVISSWANYFISQEDSNDGYGVGPNYNCPYANSTADYGTHNNIPLIEYYLQQFAAKEASGGTRLLDYLDMHTYFAAQGAQFSTAGSAGLQASRLDSTRALWDPTYVDGAARFPNVIKTSNYDPCASPVQLPPMLIPRAKAWVAKDYPGTKVAFTEYNWGAFEDINGALTQADVLGIFGREGLDMAFLWGPPNPVATANTPSQYPEVAAFQMYTNYDGNNSKFGDMALTSVSTLAPGVDGEGYLAVYGAQRTSDNAITVMVINKGPEDQTSTLSLLNTTASGSANSYQFAGTNIKAIVAGPAYSITAPASGSTTSTITGVFPAQSITLLIIPQAAAAAPTTKKK